MVAVSGQTISDVVRSWLGTVGYSLLGRRYSVCFAWLRLMMFVFVWTNKPGEKSKENISFSAQHRHMEPHEWSRFSLLFLWFDCRSSHFHLGTLGLTNINVCPRSTWGAWMTMAITLTEIVTVRWLLLPVAGGKRWTHGWTDSVVPIIFRMWGFWEALLRVQLLLPK